MNLQNFRFDLGADGVALLTWIAGGLGLVGMIFCILGFLALTAVHLS